MNLLEDHIVDVLLDRFGLCAQKAHAAGHRAEIVMRRAALVLVHRRRTPSPKPVQRPEKPHERHPEPNACRDAAGRVTPGGARALNGGAGEAKL
ncbi:hypothetical protein [Desulfarculus baarsii]|uniref:hypothetical protein n=1 Tax=Desulfarculus baarsii TaxID=453230 RepID=UPI000312FE94|nr:hypothetical protein [Desulfarculus baarsii]